MSNMLREVPNGVSTSLWGLVLKIREAPDGEKVVSKKYLEQARTVPVRFNLPSPSMPDYWLWQGRLYRATVKLDGDEFRALLADQALRTRKRIDKALATAASADQPTPTRRQPIPLDVKTAVWQRDGGRCVECGSNENLEFDHIIPLAKGGANTFRNLQLLCADCNRRKGASLG